MRTLCGELHRSEKARTAAVDTHLIPPQRGEGRRSFLSGAGAGAVQHLSGGARGLQGESAGKEGERGLATAGRHFCPPDRPNWHQDTN